MKIKNIKMKSMKSQRKLFRAPVSSGPHNETTIGRSNVSSFITKSFSSSNPLYKSEITVANANTIDFAIESTIDHESPAIITISHISNFKESSLDSSDSTEAARQEIPHPVAMDHLRSSSLV